MYIVYKKIKYLRENIYFYVYFTLNLISGVAKKSQWQKGVMNEKSLRIAALVDKFTLFSFPWDEK